MTVRYAKPPILAKIPKDRHAVIEASAGTGKTFTLEHLVVDLILTTDLTISQILVVTFTERATGELRQRVRAILQRLLDLREEAPSVAGLPDEACWILDDAARARLERALRQFDTATISTIHGFCRKILTEHAFANQRLFAEKNVDGREAFAAAFLDTVRDTLAVAPAYRPILDRWLAARSLGKLEELLHGVMRERAAIRPALEGDDGSLDLEAIDEGRVTLEALAVQRFLPLVRERLEARKREQGLFDFDDMLTLVQRNLRGEHGEALVRILRGRYACALIDEFQDTDEVQWEIFRRVFFESPGTNHLYLIGDPKQAIYRFRGADVETYLTAKREILDAGGERVPLRDNYRSTSGLIDGYNLVLDQRADPPFFTSGGIDYAEPVSCGNGDLRLVGPDGRDAAPIHVFELGLPMGKTGKVLKGQEHVLPPLGARIAAEIRAITDPTAPALLYADGTSEPRRIDHRDIYVLCRTTSEGAQIGRQLRAAGVPHAFYKQDGLLQTSEAVALHDLLAAVADPDDRSKRLRAFLSPFFDLQLRDLPEVLDLPGTDPLVERLASWKRDADERRFERLFARILDESGLTRRLILSDRGDRALTNYLHIVELLQEAVGASCRTLPELVRLLGRWIGEEAKPESEEGNQQRLESDRNAVQIMTMHASKGLEAKVVFVVGGLSASGGPPREAVLKITSFHGEGGRRIAWIGDAPTEVKALAKQEERWEDQRLLYVALTRAKARLYLPMYRGPGGEGGVIGDCCYRPVDDRLHALDSGGGLEASGFSREAIEMGAPEESRDDVAALAAEWDPPASIFRDVETAAAEALVEGRRGYAITSYTQMKTGASAPAAHDPEPDEFAADRERAPKVSAGELPGGAETGIFLHEVLAKVEPSLVCRARSPDELLAIPEVESLLRAEAAQGGIDPARLAHAARLVHLALTTNLELHGGRVLAGIGAAPGLLREMEFLFPIPEGSHPRLDQGPPAEALEIRRGFVKGFVDFLFEHEGLAYFGDWKSDVLPGYGAEAIAERTASAYGLQARLYSLALVKMLGIRSEAAFDARFGGYLYVYLRGTRHGSADGIHFARPTWKQILAWEAELLERGEERVA